MEENSQPNQTVSNYQKSLPTLATMNPTRKHPLAECESCPLREGSVYVPTRFARNESSSGRRLAIVGEAPGIQEGYFGEPFVGPSGKLIDRVLRHYRIARSTVTLTNATLCRPEDNATPSAAAIAACRPRLLAEVDQATEILALGNTAAQSLLGTKQGVTALRVGPPRDWQGKKLVVSFHPAACLRNGDFFPSLTNDVGKLLRHQPAWSPPEYVVIDDEETALEAIRQLHDLTDKLVIDIECGIDKDNSFDHPDRYQMLCVGICYAKGKVAVFGENSLTKPVYAAFKALFNVKKLIAQNGKFDFAGLYRHVGPLKLWFDTMLAHYCIDERPGIHDLGYMGVELLGTPSWKNEIGQFLGEGKNYAAIPRPILYKYNAYDDAVTWDLYELFESELERLGLRSLHDFLCAASDQLMYPELNGVKIDFAINDALDTEYLEILEAIEAELNPYIERDYDKRGGINPRSPKQLKAFYEDNRIILESTDKDTLKALLDKLDPDSSIAGFTRTLLQHRRKVKLHGTYIKGIRKRTYHGRVFTTYRLHGTTSGRLASRNPNLQNIVRDKGIKRQFGVSHVDNIWIGADYAQVEGRVMTTLAEDEYLAGIFRDPTRDLFNELGKRLYGKDDLTKDERVRVKAYFYGLGYGRDSYSIAMEYGWSPREAERDVRNFKRLIPGIVAWQDSVIRQTLTEQELITTFGRHRRFSLITKQNRKDVLNEALSFYPQSTASDICLRALIRVRPRLRGLGHLRLTIYDQLVAEGPEKNKEEITAILVEEMERSGREWSEYVPFPVDVTYGKNWSEL